MPAKAPDLSMSQLLELMPKMMDESPSLARDVNVKNILLSILRKLPEPQLRQLHQLLQSEDADWRSFIASVDKERQKIVDDANTQSLTVVKEVERFIRKEKEITMREKEKKEAEKLLKKL